MANSSARVLLVEDDLALAGIYKQYLEVEGYKVLHCKDGQEAIEKLEDFYPTLILLDLMTPRVSGFDVITLVRKKFGASHPKILVLTAMGQPENEDRAMKLGADEYLIKSQVELHDVMSAVKRLLQPKASPSK